MGDPSDSPPNLSRRGKGGKGEGGKGVRFAYWRGPASVLSQAEEVSLTPFSPQAEEVSLTPFSPPFFPFRSAVRQQPIGRQGDQA